MNSVCKRRRPVKRCRRGRDKNTSPSINFNIKNFNLVKFIQNSNLASTKIQSGLNPYLFCGLLVICIFLFLENYNLVEASNFTCFFCISSIKIDDHSGLFTKKAQQEVANLINPNKKEGPITLRDAYRFINKYEKLKYVQKILRGKNKNLTVQCKKLKDKNKLLQQNQVKKREHLTLLKQEKDYYQDELELKATLTSPQFDNNGIVHIESSRLIKVWLGSNCSFRSFSRVIYGLLKHDLYRGHYCPSPNTLINWCIRAGMAKLNGVKKTTGPCIDIMDHWIGKGDCKIFAVLRISASKYKKRNKNLSALNLSDFELVHLEIMKKSNGEKVCSSLRKLHKKIGAPVAIISDDGSDLNKGLRLVNEQIFKKNKIYHIKDISHKLACVFKKEYENLDWFKDFYTILGNGNKKLQNGMYANLKSPSQNTKARFMNIYKQVKWYIDRIDNIQRDELSKEECTKFKEVYGDLKQYKSKINSLHQTIILSHKVMEVLKVKGLNAESRKECLEIIFSNQGNKKVKQSIVQWLNDHQAISKKLSKRNWPASMPITSDPIECFFSKYKVIQKRTPQGDPTRLIAILPLLVGNDSAEEIHNLISKVGHKEALKWVEKNVPQTIHSKKRKLGIVCKEKKRTKRGNLTDQRRRPYERARAA